MNNPGGSSNRGQPGGTDRLDVDVRFLMANERTLLAWLRTALALQAGGVALIQVAGNRAALTALGIGLLALGTVCAIIGYRRSRAAEIAIRAGRLPIPGRGPAVLTVGIVTLAAVLVTVYLIKLL